jgi:serine/threonine protein kinase
MNVTLGSKFRLKNRIGGGSFGQIYSAEHTITGEELAVKIESVKSRPAQLLNESRVYHALSGGVGIPSVRWYGSEDEYNLMVMDHLDSSLESLFTECNRSFSLKTVLMIADQLLDRLEYMHRRGIIHRDIKPDNFVIGRRLKSNVIYAIDFGLAKRYRDTKHLHHIPYVEGKQLVGTARYTSVNTHLGIEQSRRDDLEGIAYMLIYFMKGSLPWIGLKGETRQAKYTAICESKVATSIDSLCKGLPCEFAIFLGDVRRLEFTDEPHYSRYREMFRDLFVREQFVYDYVFDWTIKRKPPPIQHSYSLLRESESRVFNHPVATFARPNESSLSNLQSTQQMRKAIPTRLGKRVSVSPLVTAPTVKTAQRAYRY